jgi:hypothetical protein
MLVTRSRPKSWPLTAVIALFTVAFRYTFVMFTFWTMFTLLSTYVVFR